MPIDPLQSVSDLVLEHSECAVILKRHGLDFCCRGNTTIAAACTQRGVPFDLVEHELGLAISERQGSCEPDPRNLSTRELISLISLRHHSYLREALPFLQGLASKVARVHGPSESRLLDLKLIFDGLAAGLSAHIDDEELALFPLLLAPGANAALIESRLSSMHEEHLEYGRSLDSIREVTSDFTLPSSACHSYRTLFTELEQLELQLNLHLQLEEHVLRPRFTLNPSSHSQKSGAA
jgi:regulator of cell morphogenesis and NO signaling